MRIPLCAAILIAFTACGTQNDSERPTNEHREAVNNGEVDSSNAFPFVGALVNPGDNKHHCTGTLLTPFWMVAAAHCFDGTYWNPTSNNLTFELAHDLTSVPAASKFPKAM